MVLPVAALSLGAVAVVARQFRASLALTLASPHVPAALSRGLSRRQILVRHGLRNALAPTVTIIGLQLVGLLGGAVIVEMVFAVPGIGMLALDAVNRQDAPVVMGFVLITALVVVIMNIVIDVAHAALDPRVRPS
jgi:peptide/nickel transport system permease protein